MLWPLCLFAVPLAGRALRRQPEDTEGQAYGALRRQIEDPEGQIDGALRREIESREGQTYMAPTALFIGTGHSGSTSLADHLNMHPELSYGYLKEHGFFCRCCHESDNRSLESYVREFPVVSGRTKRTFDATMAYLYVGSPGPLNGGRPASYFRVPPGPAAVRNVRRLLGADTRFLVMFRDPIERLHSVLPNLTLPEMQEMSWFTCSHRQLGAWMAEFPRDNFLFLDSEEYFNLFTRQAALDRVLSFFGVSAMEYTVDQLLYQSGRRRSATKVSPQLRKAFAELESSRKCKDKLEELTGLQFNWQYY